MMTTTVLPSNRSTWCRLSMICLWLALGAFVARSAEPAASSLPIEPRVRDLLTQSLQTVGDARTLSAHVTTRMRVEMQGMKQEMPAEYSLALARPNRFAMRLESGFAGATVVSDGKKLHTYVPMLKQYLVVDAPADLGALSQSGEVAGVLSAPGGGAGFLTDMFGTNAQARILEGVTAAQYAGHEVFEGTDCHRLKFQQEGMQWELWLTAAEPPLPRKMVADLGQMMQQMGGAGGLGGEGGEMAEMFKNLKMTLEIQFDDWVLNQPIPDDRFAFVVPEGAQQVEEFAVGMGEESGEEAEHELVGKPAPLFKAPLLKGGGVDLAGLKGRKVVVLDFWATWCGPCVRALPILAEVTREFASRDVAFYAVNLGEDKATIEAFLKRRELDLSVVLDPDSEVGDDYGVESIPQTVIIDKEGRVRRVHVGASPDLREQITRDLEEILGPPSGSK